MPSSRLNKEAIDAYRNMLLGIGLTDQEASTVIAARMAAPMSQQPGEMTLEAGSEERTAELFIYGAIGDDFFQEGVTARTLADQLRALGQIDAITVRLNSPGGLAFDGLAIYNLLAQHDAHITIKVDGMAASAASVVAMAGDTIEMAENAMMMIHNASGFAFGDHRVMLEEAAILEKLDGQIARTYAARAGRKDEAFRRMMNDETWFTAQEAVDNKLAHTVTPAKKAAALADFDLSMYQNAPNGWREASDVVSALCGKTDGTMQQQVATRLRLLDLDAQEAV